MTSRRKKEIENEDKRPSTSLPLFYREIELCDIGPRTGMECMPLRSPPGPYHYHINDQTKSLQELQNEVGALLEFRDLVIETFPDLKNKMASSSSASSTLTGLQSSLASRREWEPGIRVRRKLIQKENSEISSSSLIRSRSNSHSGKKEPKSGEGNGSVVQDSGFSTETNSSKETHSASSTSGTNTTQTILLVNSQHRLPLVDAEDELWNLLDVIHRKSTRLREEVEYLQNYEREQNKNGNSMTGLRPSTQPHFLTQLDRINKEDENILRKERDHLLDKLAEMEAITITSQIKTSQVEEKLEAMCIAKQEIEDQLQIALNQKIEFNSRIGDIHEMYISHYSDDEYGGSGGGSPNKKLDLLVTRTGGASTTAVTTINQNKQNLNPLIIKPSPHIIAYDNKNIMDSKFNLGRLDGVVSTPNRLTKVRVADSKKIAAILLETNPIELQRHLLTVTFQNQVLQQRLEGAVKSKLIFVKRIEKAKDDIEDLKFQLEEKNIELEGTKAQLRVLESKQIYSPEHVRSPLSPSRESTLRLQSVSTPSMRAMVPLAIDELLHNSSSTESAQDQADKDKCLNETPKRSRPSKIPTKSYSAPKPPTGRSQNSLANNNRASSVSGPSSNKSLSKSTNSLLGKSDSNLLKKNETTPSSLTRSDSVQSWRRDQSLNNRSSSIPISTKSTNQLIKPISPQTKPKRDSLTSKVKNLDSLTRIQSNASANAAVLAQTQQQQQLSGNLYKSTSKKDLSSSFSTGSGRTDRKQISVPVRRVSSVSVNRSNNNNNNNSNSNISNNNSNGGNDHQNEENGKDQQQIMGESISRDLIKEYLTKSRAPPPIFQVSPLLTNSENQPHHLNTTTTASFESHIDLAYKHPIMLLETTDDAPNDNNESFIIPTPNKNAFSSLTESVTTTTTTTDNNTTTISMATPTVKSDGDDQEKSSCRLIGKVNPNIIKTWEQLSGFQLNQKNLVASITNSETSDQQSCVLFYRKPLNFDKPEDEQAKYYVNKMRHSESSDDFYDSIDDDRSIIENNTYIVDDLMTSSMYQDSEIAAGEGMAEMCESLIDII